MSKISQEEFYNIAIECEQDPNKILKILKQRFPKMEHRPSKVTKRLENYRKKGILPLSSGNSVSYGELLKGTSTLYDASGKVKQQWVKTDVSKEDFLASYKEVIESIAETLPSLQTVTKPITFMNEELTTLYISNDVHFGLHTWKGDTEGNWNTSSMINRMKEAYDYLFDNTPNSKYGIIADLGDLVESPDDTNRTRKSGNPLDVDGKHAQYLRAAYESMIYAVNKALVKHEIVYFYNVTGNHDFETATAIREVIRVAFLNNPRVIVNDTAHLIKYHQFGSVLLQFFHGDNMKLRQAGETMAHDCQSIFSQTTHRYAHAGHTHVDAVHDGKLCKAESHRNLAPNNTWAHSMGYRRQLGTMKAITYHKENGEISRNIFTVNS